MGGSKDGPVERDPDLVGRAEEHGVIIERDLEPYDPEAESEVIGYLVGGTSVIDVALLARDVAEVMADVPVDGPHDGIVMCVSSGCRARGEKKAIRYPMIGPGVLMAGTSRCAFCGFDMPRVQG